MSKRAVITEEETALYRFFNDSGRLLYVGITRDPGQRFSKHATGKPWWQQVRVIRTCWFPTREDAVAAEYQAIVSEAPLHNIIHAQPSGSIAISRATTMQGQLVSLLDVLYALTRNAIVRSDPATYIGTPEFGLDFLHQYFPLVPRRSVRRCLDMLTYAGLVIKGPLGPGIRRGQTTFSVRLADPSRQPTLLGVDLP